MRAISLWLSATLFLLVGCAGPQLSPQSTAAPGQTADIDEAGLLLQMDKFESELAQSPDRIRDPALESYLQSLTCRIAAEHCPYIRIYLVRQPLFNAAMGPNGMLIIWSGLLLRVEDEAQLAFVIGHEIGHYQMRHTLARWRKLKSTSSAAMALQVLTAGVGAGLLGAAANIGAFSTLFAFSREQERAADDFGLLRMRELEYDDRRAGELWAAIWDEDQARDKARQSAIFASHPASEERRNRLRAAAIGQNLSVDTGALRKAIAPHRLQWLEDEVAQRHYRQSEILLSRLSSFAHGNDGEIAYAQAEMYRRRAQAGDLERARAAYTQATADQSAPATAWRGLGLVQRQLNAPGAAKLAFERYLALAPFAPDRALIESWIAP